MKYIVFIMLTLGGLLSAAAPNSERIKELLEYQSSCGSFIRFDDQNVFIGFGQYKLGIENPRKPIPASMTVIPYDGTPSFSLATKDAAIDLVTESGRAFILTHSSIEEWDLATRERFHQFPTYNYSPIMAQKEHAMAFARYKNKLIIAHGRLGLSFFDMNLKTITNQYRLLQSQLPLESMATGVTIQGRYAYVMMDNFHLGTPGPFRGIIIVDMETEKVVSELNGMDPGITTVTSDENYLIASFAGSPIWKYRISSLHGKKTLPAPIDYVKNYPIKGHPTGPAAMDDKYYYTCFFRAPSYPGENGGRHTKVPMVLDRQAIGLD